MKYLVVDKLLNEEREYYNITDAYKDAEKHNCILVHVNKHGEKTILEDFS